MSITAADLPPAAGDQRRGRLEGIRASARALTALAVSLALAALAAITAIALLSGQTTGRGAALRHLPVPRGERLAIAEALGYPYPPRCLTITVAAGSPDYARADIGRANGCGRYHGYVNASVHQVGGRWRLVLDEGQLFVPNSLLSPGAGYRFPIECLSSAIVLHDSRFAEAAFDRATCARARAGWRPRPR